MSKGFIALLVFALTVIITLPPLAAAGTLTSSSTSSPPNDLQTDVIQDADGNVHVLWLVPALNNSATGPGIWYSKYSPNGTDTIPTTQITNSSTIQSANLAVDGKGNAIIIWADDLKSTPPASSALYMVRFNSSQSQLENVLTSRGSLILWPSLTVDNDSSIYMTWTDYNPSTSAALVKYGAFTGHGLVETKTIASYLGADAFPPQARVTVDNSTQHIQIAWGESEKDGQSASTVNYAKLVSNGTILTQLQVAKFAATLRDVTITSTGHGGAFIAWQTTGSNYSLYVSQISPDGRLVYVKDLNDTTGESRYLDVSTDFEGNFYVVWYQPSMVAQQTITSPTVSTNVTYLQMNLDGVIVQTGTGVFRVPVIGVTVLNDGIVYGVSTDGLVRAVTPIPPRSNQLSVAAVALMSCLGVAGFVGSLMNEDGRYRWAALYSRLSVRAANESSSANREILQLLARKPGMKLREIKRLSAGHSVGAASLVEMERSGSLASVRDGVSRRFYLRGMEGGQVDALRTRILLWVLDHPGIWEAQLAKDLGLSQQIVHYHLKKLRETNLITCHTEPDGARKLYRFVNEPRETRPSA